jgi:tetratricopeptide (TPR) repeat protein
MATRAEARAEQTAPAVLRGSRLGERLRQLRVSSGLTQSDLAGQRFSKEYISQIERGKTTPTRETVEWLAARLGVDPTFLASGVSTDERARAEAILTRAEALSEKRDYEGAIDEYTNALGAVVATGAVELQVRVLSGEAWARANRGDARTAVDLLVQARGLVEGPKFSDLDRAEIVFRLGACRYLLSSVATAVALFDEALALVEGSPLPSDVLRSNIFTWRSRCYRRQRDYEAAREDINRALELAESMRDARVIGEAYFQASLIAERDGQWVLARTYAERAKLQFEESNDSAIVGKLLNNLGLLELLLGKPSEAVARLNEAFSIVLDTGDDDDLATVISSLSHVCLRTGDPATAEKHARHALTVLGSRDDRTEEIGSVHLTLGRALLELGRFDEAEEALATAEDAFAQLSSGSHSAAAWLAQGDLAQRRGDDSGAAALYRRSAEALQDYRL